MFPGEHGLHYYQDKDAKPYTPDTPVAGQFIGGRMHIISGVDQTIDTIPVSGTFSAVNVDTGKIAWQYKSEYPMIGGALATAGNLVFTGEQNGAFDAFDAKTGKKLWHFNLGIGVTAAYQLPGQRRAICGSGCRRRRRQWLREDAAAQGAAPLR